jgi:DNA-binding NtrC family response regulator
MSRVLVVDDDPDAVRVMARALEGRHALTLCGGGAAALDALQRGDVDVVLADLDMPAPDGFEVLRAARRRMPPVPVVVVSGMDSTRTTLQALQLGASDYLLKPVSPAEVDAVIARVAPTADDDGAPTFGLVGGSCVMRRIRQLVPLLARGRDAVLLIGETGTGKELLARALHDHGPRAHGPFVAHNMAATPSELVESVFFGHTRGAFTGAQLDQPGLFEQAHGGTLLLDEVDSFPLVLQPKLLRVLECGRIRRVGSSTDRDVDVRVVTTSSTGLDGLVAQGRFRADLFYRLRQLEVVLPPLRDRREDVPALARHILAELETEGRVAPALSTCALDRLLAHDWPGNVRELRHTLRSASVLAGTGPILLEHLPRTLHAAASPTPPDGAVALDSVEREHIQRVLDLTLGNQSRAARLLRIDRGTLARRLRQLGLRRPR